MSKFKIPLNKKISSEIDKKGEEDEIKDLAKAILEYEIETWRIRNLKYKEDFEKMFELVVKKRGKKD